MNDVNAAVYRAPMRSLGLCGFGEPRSRTGGDIPRGASHERLARRVERFRDIDNGSFVWTLDPEGLYWLGRITGPYFRDTDELAIAVDLVHVRECRWLPTPFLEPDVPAAVTATYRRGGRNFRQTHDDTVGAETRRLWDELS